MSATKEEWDKEIADLRAKIPICPQCGETFNPHYSERLQRAAKVCATCAWSNS